MKANNTFRANTVFGLRPPIERRLNEKSAECSGSVAFKGNNKEKSADSFTSSGVQNTDAPKSTNGITKTLTDFCMAFIPSQQKEKNYLSQRNQQFWIA